MKRLLTFGLLTTLVFSVWIFSQTVRGQEQLRPDQSTTSELWRQVEIIRTAHGVPHIRAENLRAAGYALAWLQSEDYGPRTALNVLEARGQLAKLNGSRENIESDFLAAPERNRVIQTYHLLDQETRDVYDGFAAGLNRYIDLHRQEFPARMPADFSGYDVAAVDAVGPSIRKARAFLAKINPSPSPTPSATPTSNEGPEMNSDDGSNAWAFAPSRTKSGRAILLRNPHLAWTAGYYEAHLTVPGVVDFYGDFRIGGPFIVVGGFNRNLGWSTTNNSQDLAEIYALEVDPQTTDHYLFDGASLPLTRELRTVTFKNGEGLATETREFWTTPLGPVIGSSRRRSVNLVRTACATRSRSRRSPSVRLTIKRSRSSGPAHADASCLPASRRGLVRSPSTVMR